MDPAAAAASAAPTRLQLCALHNFLQGIGGTRRSGTGFVITAAGRLEIDGSWQRAFIWAHSFRFEHAYIVDYDIFDAAALMTDSLVAMVLIMTRLLRLAREQSQEQRHATPPRLVR